MQNQLSLSTEIEKSGLFDPAWYSTTYKDVAEVGIDPLTHFVRFGMLMQRSPGPRFDARFYLAHHKDVAAAGLQPLMHYIRFGRAEGRVATPAELAARPPVKAPAAKAAAGGHALPPGAPAQPHWQWRLAQDAFMMRGLTPAAPIAVVINAADPAAWQDAQHLLAAVMAPDGLDLFLLGPETHDLSAMPKTVRTISYLGAADEPANAKGFVRFAASGAADAYDALLWLSPKDGGPAAKDAAMKIAAAGAAFVADPGWGCAGPHVSDVRQAKEEALVFAMRVALPRLGLGVPEALPVPTGTAIWIRPLLLRALEPTVRPFEMTTDGKDNSFPGRKAVLGLLSAVALEAGMEVRAAVAPAAKPPAKLPAAAAPRSVKAVAFYLPQFHPIAENDKWWGKGFTEWSNVVRGKPLFRHHYQPRVPADLGFYDLRLEDTQAAQADLARDFGLHGFCYYYYWFNGKKLLNQPIEQMARSSRVDTAFCVCWANENWSRNWDGQNRHVLMQQDYSLESNLALMREMIPMMKDPRWVRHNGKPVMVVYRISIIPNWMETAREWRRMCHEAGLGDIHLCAVRFGLETLEGQPKDHGLDSYVLFPPHEAPRKDLRKSVLDLHGDFGGEIFEYNAVVDGDVAKYAGGYDWPVHRGAMLGWDNTARRLTDARIFHGATPYGFRRWIKSILEQEAKFNTGPESLLFINAWNEWAEGTYMEPDQRWGRANLAAFASAVKSVPGIRAVTVPKGTAAGPKVPARLADAGQPLSPTGAGPAFPVWHAGARAHDPALPTVMLCAHISGHHLFGGERSLLDVLDAFSTLPVNVVMTLPSGNNRAYIDEICKRCTGTYVLAYPQWLDNRPTQAWLAATFADLLARHGVDVVHCNTIVLAEPALAAQRMGRLSVIHSRELISLDDPLRERMKLNTGEIVAEVFRRSDFVVGNSRATCALFARGARTLYVPNAVEPADFDMGNKFGTTIKFGIVSSNIPKKGVADFVEVAARAAARAPHARFVVIGPDNAQTLAWAAEVKRGDRPANLAFLGYRDTPRAAMGELNVLVNLSGFAESFGRTVAEGLVARRPVIAYDWGALPELIQHGTTGFLVPYRDIDAVVDAVVTLCDDRDRILAMGEAGRSFIAAHFAQTNLRQALAESYEAVLGRPMRGQAALPGAAPLVPAAQRIGIAPRTTVIIPVYNAPDEVRACIASVIKHTDLSQTRVLIIDDGSPDPAVAPMLRAFEGTAGLTILKNEPNMGYTRTINRGIAEAGADDVILLNSDTVVTPRWLEGLRATAYSREKVATVTAMSDNAGAFSFPVFNEYCPKPDHLSHEEYATLMMQATQGCTPPEVPTGSGFCLFIRRALIEACGLFDHEGFPRGYGEENDFCMRARAAGWVNLISPWSFVFHIRTASFKGEKTALVKAGVDVVTKRYPDYANLVKAAFAGDEMAALRAAAAETLHKT